MEDIIEIIEKIKETEDTGYAYLYPLDGSGRKDYYISLAPENLANFLGSHYYDAKKMIITDVLDNMVLNTIGGFIDRCADKELLEEILPVLIPIQEGEKEAGEILIVTRDELEQYYEHKRQYVMTGF